MSSNNNIFDELCQFFHQDTWSVESINLINEDVYILVSLESRNYDHISDLNKLVVGVLAADLEDVSYYMSSGTNLTYKSYASSEDLFSALNNGSVNTIVIPHIMYLNKILSSDTNYYINYTLSEMSKSVVFTLSDTNSKLNDIFVKYFNSWKNNSFVSVYNSELFDFYVNSKGITDSVKKELQAETYVYGYVENSPYEIVVDDNFYGIAAEYVNRINRLSGVDFEYKKYDSVEELKKAIDKKEIDIYFNYYDVAGKDYKEVNSTFIEEYVVLARTKDSHVVGSFQALKGKDISMLANTALLNYFKDKNKNKDDSEFSRKKQFLVIGATGATAPDPFLFSVGLSIGYENFKLLYPFYFGAFFKPQIGFTSPSFFPYHYKTADGSDFPVPCLIRGQLVAEVGYCVTLSEKHKLDLLISLCVGANVSTIWNFNFSSSVASNFYFSFYADANVAIAYRYIYAMFTASYDAMLGFNFGGGLGLSIKLGK